MPGLGEDDRPVAVPVDSLASAADEPRVRKVVVSVEHQHPFAPGVIGKAAAVVRDAAKFAVVAQVPEPPVVRPGPRSPTGAVGRGVVEDDHFEGRVILAQGAGDGLIDEPLLVIGGDQDGDPRRGCRRTGSLDQGLEPMALPAVPWAGGEPGDILAEELTQVPVLYDPGEPRGDRVGVVGDDQTSRPMADHLLGATDVGHDHGKAEGQRLEHDRRATLRAREEGEDVA